MSEVKSELKLAREAIKKKEYKEALKHCKNVMKVDKENYNALVFIGLCATELNQFEQAKQAYGRAIDHNKDHASGWQGFVNLLERANNNTWSNELTDAYSVLLTNHISESEKWKETCKKLIAHLSKNNNLEEVYKWQKELLSRCHEIPNVIELRKDITTTLSNLVKLKGPSEDQILELLGSYKNLIAVSEEEHINIESCVVSYLQLLMEYSKHGYESYPNLTEISKEMEKLHRMFESNLYILQVLCTTMAYEQLDQESIGEDRLTLMKTFTENATGDEKGMQFTVGLLHYLKDEYKDALSAFTTASLVVDHADPLVLFYMAKASHFLHQTKKSVEFIGKCRRVLGNIIFTEATTTLEKHLDMLEAQNLLEANEKSQTVLKALHDKLSRQEDDINVMLVNLQILVQVGETNILSEVISKAEDMKNSFTKCQKSLFLQIKAEISIFEKKYYDAEVRLQEAQEAQDNFKVHFLLGKVYWLLGNEKTDNYQQAYAEFLKAAKKDQLYANTFVYLGCYQRQFIKDYQKALKCFEKAFSLDVSNTEAGSQLGDMYLQTHNEDKAAKVYEIVTSQAKIGESVWAWVRLGLIYLKKNENDAAIKCFQHALRGRSDVSHYWECLGDAYFMRGSYLSSMKAFTKASQLDDSSVYCRYKIAKVKQMLCLDVEAIKAYEELVQKHPKYVPALLGLCETHLHLLQDNLAVTFDGRAVDHAQCILNFASKAVQIQPGYTFIWKVLGDGLVALHVVKPDLLWLEIPENLQKVLSIPVQGKASKVTVMEVGTRCFMMAVKLHENIASYWHDLSVSVFHYGMILDGQPGKEKVLQSVQIIKKAISIDPTNAEFWNTLGVITGCSGPSQQCCGHNIDDIQNPALSQHAFIKALQLNPQNASYWANLGILYLKHDKVKAAHEAFKKAQSCDPKLVQAWVGQAYIAELIADNDAMDLFRHSTELTFHGESSLAYAQWVCKLLKSIESQSVVISTKPKPDLSHLPKPVKRIIPNASVSLQKSLARNDQDPWSNNVLGLLLEHEGLYKQAELVFGRARTVLNSKPTSDKQTAMLRQVLINQARVLCELKKYDDAIEIYNIASLQSAREICGLGLTYYKAGQFQKSFQAYEKALKVATEDHEKSEILAALGMISYAMHNADSAKSFLFRSSQTKDCNQHGLMALTALGLLHGDGTLSTAALAELAKHKLRHDEGFEVKRCMLYCAFHMLQGQAMAAERTLVKAIIRYPQNTELWCHLSNFLMKNRPKQFKTSMRCYKAALFQEPNEISSKMAAVGALAFPKIGSPDVLRYAQRLVHNHPDKPESWVLLSTALLSQVIMEGRDTTSSLVSLTRLALIKVDEHLTSLKQERTDVAGKNRLLSLYTNLYSWMMKAFVVSNIFYGDVKAADSFCNRVIPTLTADWNKTDFIFLKGLAIVQEQFNQQAAVSSENIRVMSTVACQSNDPWKWQIMVRLYASFSVPVSADLCYRQISRMKTDGHFSCVSVLVQACLLAMRAFEVSKDSNWSVKYQEYIDELIKHHDGDKQNYVGDEHNYVGDVILLLRSILFHQQGNQKAALKYLNKLNFVTNPLLSKLHEGLLNLWKT